MNLANFNKVLGTLNLITFLLALIGGGIVLYRLASSVFFG